MATPHANAAKRPASHIPVLSRKKNMEGVIKTFMSSAQMKDVPLQDRLRFCISFLQETRTRVTVPAQRVQLDDCIAKLYGMMAEALKLSKE